MSIKQTQIFTLQNLGCANCAAKMEHQIQKLPGISQATITFATKQLRISGEQPLEDLTKLQRICASIEPDVIVIPQQENKVFPDKKSFFSPETISLLLGSGAFALALFSQRSFGQLSILLFAVSYLILGGKILLTAAKNMAGGHVFDENFLMSIATIGAFAIAEYPEAAGVMLFFRIGELFEERAVEKSRRQIMEAADLRPDVVSQVHGEHVHVIPAAQAAVGDILLVRPGDRIPLDGTIIEGSSRVDTSPVTGEPVPVSVSPGSPVISGCINTSGVMKLRVEKELKDSMVTRILDSVENAAANKPRLDRFITRFARIYTPIVVAIAAATAIVPSLATGNWAYWIYTALTFLVISCPCALVLSVPLAFFSGIGCGSKKGILFKGGSAIEALSEIKAVVMDKTGTITKGNFAVQKILASHEFSEEQILEMAAECEASSTHPIAASITAAFKERFPEKTLKQPGQLQEIPGKGLSAGISQGRLLCGNKKLMEENGVSFRSFPTNPKNLEAANQPGASGETILYLALNSKPAGLILISDTVKEDSPAAISSLKKQSIVTAMLTGDNENAARSVAGSLGVDHVYAKLLPEDKLSRLQEIRNQYGSVMFVGDGINDAPVLAGADVGAAMGSGADAAIEAADVVFMTSSLQAVPDSIRIAKMTSAIARQNIIFALGIKALIMVLGLAGFASMWMAVFADTGVAMLCVLNSVRLLYKN